MSPPRAPAFLLVIAVAFAHAAAPDRAAAHSRPLSYSAFRAQGDDVDVRVQIAPGDIASIGFDPGATQAQSDQIGDMLQRSLTMSVGGTRCSPLGPAVRAQANEPWLAWQWNLRCKQRGERRIHAGFDALLRTGHRHLVRFEEAGRAVDRVLELADNDWVIGPAGGAYAQGSSLFDYVGMGIEHLLTGWDHLVFVLALLLLAVRLREVVLLVTSFTLAHTLSLGLSAAHLVQPQQAPVEALIGFSIALLGIENCWLLAGRGRSVPALATLGLLALALHGGGVVSRVALAGLAVFCLCHFALLQRASEPARLRIAIAFAFGLIHGLGFAAVMAQMALPTDRLVQALLGFNVGVELGQLAVVVLLWPLLLALARVREGRVSRLFIETTSAAISGLGLFWFVTRSFG